MAVNGAGHEGRLFRLTLRREMILVAYSAVLLTVYMTIVEGSGEEPWRVAARVFLLVSPWVLGGLLALFDVPGPARNWLAIVCFFLFYPALAVDLDLSIAKGVVEEGMLPDLRAAAVFHVAVVVGTAVFASRMSPVSCPSCRQSCLIPLLRIEGQSRRLTGTRWCAACGGLFWRDEQGRWRKERRATWVGRQPAIAEELPARPTPHALDALAKASARHGTRPASP